MIRPLRPSALLAPAWRGLRANLIPGLILQLFAFSLIGAYALSPDFAALLHAIGRFKNEWGYGFSAISTALFGGAIPFLVLWAGRRLPRGRVAKECLFYLAFWAWKGAEIDALYRAQGWLFGDDASFGTIASKTLVDQFVYNPIWEVPQQVLLFLWKDSAFSVSNTKCRLQESTLLQRCLVVLLSTWLVWIPAVSLVYSLPAALQIPLFNLVLCFWCLLLSFISRTTQAT